MTNARQELGRRGEDAACAFLEQKGMQIIERNWKCSYGEADIIALDNGELVFCEVKTRKGTSAGLPEDAVTPRKQQRYIKMAQLYQARSQNDCDAIRFDVISIFQYSETQALLRYLKNAFDGTARP